MSRRGPPIGAWLESGAAGLPGTLAERPSQRIRPEGRAYQERAYSGSGVAAALNLLEIQGTPIAPKISTLEKPDPVKNFESRNRSYIRRLQKDVQGIRNTVHDQKPDWMIRPKYADVKAKVITKSQSSRNLHEASVATNGHVNGDTSASVPRPARISPSKLLEAKSRLKSVSTTAIHRAGQTNGRWRAPSVEPLALERTPAVAPSPALNSLNHPKQRPSSAKKAPAPPSQNFLRRNIEAAAGGGQLKKSASLLNLSETLAKKEEDFKKHKSGTLPKYLQERKAAVFLAAEDAKKAERLRLSGCPPGHSLLSYDERLKTLESLRASEAELIRKLNSLPVREDTTFLRRRKEEIRVQLADVDAAIAIFQKPKVFVKDDERE